MEERATQRGFSQEVRHKILVVNNWWAYGRPYYSNLSFELLPKKKSTESCEDSLGMSKEYQNHRHFASRNTGRFRSLDVLYLFVPMTFLRDGSSYDPSKIVKFSCKWPVDGLREKVETWRGSEYYWWNKSHFFTIFYTCEVVQNFFHQRYYVNVCYLFALNLFDQVMWRRKKCCFISWDQDVSGQRK